jgi:hypothetical protein
MWLALPALALLLDRKNLLDLPLILLPDELPQDPDRLYRLPGEVILCPCLNLRSNGSRGHRCRLLIERASEGQDLCFQLAAVSHALQADAVDRGVAACGKEVPGRVITARLARSLGQVCRTIVALCRLELLVEGKDDLFRIGGLAPSPVRRTDSRPSPQRACRR